MIPESKHFLKAAFLCVAFLLHACSGTSLFTRQEDFDSLQVELASIQAGLESMQTTLEKQSTRMDTLESIFEQHNRLVCEEMGHHHRSIEWLGQRIREVDEKARRRMKNPQKQQDPQFSHQSEITSTDKLMVGEIEKLWLAPPGRVFHARIDTGATTSSVDARDIELFERDGNTWVRFKIADPGSDLLYEVEKPVVRHVKILQASSSETDRRPVVNLQFQLGRLKVIEEFTLVDRQHLDYQVLIGRNILRDLMIVDVSRQFIVPLPESTGNGNGPR